MRWPASLESRVGRLRRAVTRVPEKWSPRSDPTELGLWGTPEKPTVSIPSLSIGPYRVHFVSAGRFRLDGGAMFGVVPKTLWSRVAPADERNRIRMRMTSLLIEGNGRRVLVDAGCGTKPDPKFRDIYAIEGPEELISGLAELNLAPDEIDTVAMTHLHFDHCGGGTGCDPARPG